MNIAKYQSPAQIMEYINLIKNGWLTLDVIISVSIYWEKLDKIMEQEIKIGKRDGKFRLANDWGEPLRSFDRWEELIVGINSMFVQYKIKPDQSYVDKQLKIDREAYKNFKNNIEPNLKKGK